MTDADAQLDESLVLASIFEDDHQVTITADQEAAGGGVAVVVDLPQPYHVTHSSVDVDGDAKQRLFPVQYLPPVELAYTLPADYPSHAPPHLNLTCSWLTHDQVANITGKLLDIWNENHNEVILYEWITFLKNEAITFLQLDSPLDLSKVTGADEESSKADTASGGNDVELAPLFKRQISKQDAQTLNDLCVNVLEFNKSFSEATFKRTFYNCEVCFMENLGANCTQFLGCGHVFCKACMTGYFTVLIEDGTVQGLVCPVSECDTQAHPAQVQALVSSDVFARYDRLLLQTTLAAMADVTYCPRPDCGTAVIEDAGVAFCHACSFVFCTLCNCLYHGGSYCKIPFSKIMVVQEQYKSASEEEKERLEKQYGKSQLSNQDFLLNILRDAYDNSSSSEQRSMRVKYGDIFDKTSGAKPDRLHRDMVQIMYEIYKTSSPADQAHFLDMYSNFRELKLNEMWKEKYSKQCPKCRADIQKSEGCNKMTCSRCNTSFCWLCLKILNSNSPYDHFSRGNGRCRGLLMEGGDDNSDDD